MCGRIRIGSLRHNPVGLNSCATTRYRILKTEADNDRVIDKDGFRPNVGIVICNEDDQVLWGRRVNGRDSWQFPQGGIHRGETPEVAMYRELEEEVGLKPDMSKYWGEPRVGCITGCPSDLFVPLRIPFASAKNRFGF